MPELLGRYELERKLAQGGMGEIHLARQAGPGGFSRKCVIKRMHAEVSQDPSFVQMFLAEARVTAHLNHPNIAQLYDFGQEAGAYYLAMEYVPGVSVAALNRWHLEQKRFVPTDATLKILSEAARALHYAHTALDDDGRPLGLVHRDVSPGNILVSTSGTVKLIDFGVAKVAQAAVKTQNGVVKGKIQFMAPEQAAGQPVDGRTDVYSLGLVAYELLSGRRAFLGGQVEVVLAMGRNQFAPIDQARPGLKPSLCSVVTKALATKPADRFASAAEFAKALDAELTSDVLPAGLAGLVMQAMAPAGPVPELPPDARRTAPQAQLGAEDLPATGEQKKMPRAFTVETMPVVAVPSPATARTTQVSVEDVAAAMATQRVRRLPVAETEPDEPTTLDTLDVSPPMGLRPVVRPSAPSSVSVSVVAPAKARGPMIGVGLVVLALIGAVLFFVLRG